MLQDRARTTIAAIIAARLATTFVRKKPVSTWQRARGKAFSSVGPASWRQIRKQYVSIVSIVGIEARGYKLEKRTGSRSTTVKKDDRGTAAIKPRGDNNAKLLRESQIWQGRAMRSLVLGHRDQSTSAARFIAGEFRSIVFMVFIPYFYRRGQRAFFVCRNAQISHHYRAAAVGELTMTETEKTKPEKPETRPTDDGFLSPTPPKKKLIEPAVSRASHFS
jgi:hypothetical protein